MNFFDINNICATIFDYKLSYLELFGVITGLLAVYLAAIERVINFYLGLINCVLYFAIFYQCHLYSMMILQAVYFMINCYGIYSWTKPNEKQQLIKITALKNRQRIYILLVVVSVATVWAYAVVSISAKFPDNIEKPAYPYIDALITVASIIAQILITRKKIDNWAIWIVADFVSVILYCIMGIYFTAILYTCFWLIGIKAFLSWKKEIVR
ncbi:MAG: nicotinamide riboside transporter PnuC [Prevotellaceae bacterium]|jgi:nicotinamide mononucleotide transporter|nr:nicotinamide riboside transporter PnuC [Prevotellaceae bacterium]